GGHQRPPIEYKERGHRPDMKKNHEYRGIPFNTLAAFANHCFVNHCFVAPFELSKSSFHLYGANRASTFVECRARRTSTVPAACGPLSKEDVESACEVTAIGSKELSKVWIGDVGPHVPRIEMVSEIKAHYRKPHSIL